MTEIMTTNPFKPYKVIDCIFALDSHSDGWLGEANPAKAFGGVKEQLKAQCIKLGGDAVIGCQFEYRVAVNSGLLGSKQVMEIFAYGTAIKYIAHDRAQPA